MVNSKLALLEWRLRSTIRQATAVQLTWQKNSGLPLLYHMLRVHSRSCSNTLLTSRLLCKSFPGVSYRTLLLFCGSTICHVINIDFGRIVASTYWRIL